MVEWTRDDSAAALAEGWDIFDSYGSPNGPWQICVLEEPYLNTDLGYTEKKFADDDAVWLHVWGEAATGSELHNKALAFVQQHNLQEYESIVKLVKERGGVWRT